MDHGSKIIGVGSYLPEKILTNFDLEKLVETSDEWIIKRTGIKERRIAKEDEDTSDLALMASISALDNSGIEKEEIDAVIVATSTPDRTMPSVAAILVAKLGIKKEIPCFDLQAVCAGFVYGLSIIDGMIKSGKYQNILFVGVDKMSNIVNWKDRNTCILFGDGAGAVIISKSKEIGILDYTISGDGNNWNFLYSGNEKNATEMESFGIHMQGQEVFKNAVTKLSESVNKIISDNKISFDELDFVVTHQANYRIIDAIADRLPIKKEKFLLTLEKYGNTSAASIPITLHEGMKNGNVKNGDLGILTGIGSGLVWGSVLIKL